MMVSLLVNFFQQPILGQVLPFSDTDSDTG